MTSLVGICYYDASFWLIRPISHFVRLSRAWRRQVSGFYSVQCHLQEINLQWSIWLAKNKVFLVERFLTQLSCILLRWSVMFSYRSTLISVFLVSWSCKQGKTILNACVIFFYKLLPTYTNRASISKRLLHHLKSFFFGSNLCILRIYTRAYIG